MFIQFRHSPSLTRFHRSNRAAQCQCRVCDWRFRVCATFNWASLFASSLYEWFGVQIEGLSMWEWNESRCLCLCLLTTFLFSPGPSLVTVRVAHLAIFEKSPITFEISRIPTEDIELKDSLDSELQFESMSSIGIFNILEVIAKTSFSKIAKC